MGPLPALAPPRRRGDFRGLASVNGGSGLRDERRLGERPRPERCPLGAAVAADESELMDVEQADVVMDLVEAAAQGAWAGGADVGLLRCFDEDELDMLGLEDAPEDAFGNLGEPGPPERPLSPFAAATAAAVAHWATPSSREKVVNAEGDVYPLQIILGFLGPHAVMAAARTSRFFYGACTSDYQWLHRCDALWRDKVYVPPAFRNRSMPRVAAFWGSLHDAKRCAIREEELCGLTFYHRMKGWSGESWTAEDPWWTGGAAVQRHFHTDGTTTSELGNGTWRILDAPEVCQRRGTRGAFLRISRGGVEFPTIFVSRHPRTWGWVLQNCWAFFTSFPLPARGADAELEDDGPICQQVTVGNCALEAMLFNLGIALPGEARDTTPAFAQLMLRYHGGEAAQAIATGDSRSRRPTSGAVTRMPGVPS